MAKRPRKFSGILIILAMLIVYCIVAVTLHQLLLATLPIWVQLIYFCVAGVGWAVPAGAIVKWMAKPDAPTHSS